MDAAHDEPVTTGLYLEDFAVGQVFRTAEHTVTADEVATFAELTGDHNPLHTDPAFAARTAYGEPVAHGLLGLGLMVGLFEDAKIFDGTGLAWLGIEEWRFHEPIYFGDRIHARMTIESVRRSTSNPSQGVLTRRYELLNQRGAVVQSGLIPALVRARTVPTQPVRKPADVENLA